MIPVSEEERKKSIFGRCCLRWSCVWNGAANLKNISSSILCFISTSHGRTVRGTKAGVSRSESAKRIIVFAYWAHTVLHFLFTDHSYVFGRCYRGGVAWLQFIVAYVSSSTCLLWKMNYFLKLKRSVWWMTHKCFLISEHSLTTGRTFVAFDFEL